MRMKKNINFKKEKEKKKQANLDKPPKP